WSGGGGPRGRRARRGPRRRSTRTRSAGGRTPEVRRALSVVATVGLVLAGLAVGLLVADRALGRLANPRFTPLAGPRSTRTTLARPEFRVPVRTNSGGFRGGALPGPKPA